MKKTVPTTLAKTLFYIEEDAYTKLATYLQSVKSHFAGVPDSEEIIRDIENRIAEQFLENGSKEKIVTMDNVESLIASMGNVEDFNDSDTTSGAKKKPEGDLKRKKLFRNPDDVIVAGVASGLASYFGVEPIIVRLLFVLVVLMGGSGILIYIILWLIMPKANSTTEKLQMRGAPVTLESVKEVVQEKVNEVKANKGWFRKLISFPFLVIGMIVRFIGPIIRKFIGGIFVIVASLASFALLFVFVLTIFNIESPYVDFPLMDIGHHLAIYLGIIAGFFAILVPALFIMMLGIRMVSKAKIFYYPTVISLIGVWVFSLLTLGVVGTKLLPEYHNFRETSPIYATTSRDLPFADFTSVEVSNGNKIYVTEGKEFKVTAVGTLRGMEETNVSIKEGVLVVTKNNQFKICIFCGEDSPEITITMPKLENISASNASKITVFATSTGNLNVKLSNGSNAYLTVNKENLDLRMSNASWASIFGTTTTTRLTLSNAAGVKAYGLHTDDIILSGHNSSIAQVLPLKSLKANLSNASFAIFRGNPIIEQHTSNGSSVHKEDEEIDSMNTESWEN